MLPAGATIVMVTNEGTLGDPSAPQVYRRSYDGVIHYGLDVFAAPHLARSGRGSAATYTASPQLYAELGRAADKRAHWLARRQLAGALGSRDSG